MVVTESSRPCTKCGVNKPLSGFRKNAAYRDGYTRQCIECIGVRRVERYHANPDAEREKADKWAAANRDRINERARSRRLAALVAYSGPDPFCSCCGETVLQFLALDHIDGGGYKQRKELGGGGFYSWLSRNGFPPGFRVLCHNCNMARQFNGGTCPHDSLVRHLLGV